MFKKALSLLLVTILVAPANAGAASWMAMAMAEGNVDLSVESTQSSLYEASHSQHSSDSHHGHMGHSNLQPQLDEHGAMHDSHGEHDEEDCNEHCVSCANHCSNLGIMSESIAPVDPGKQSQRFHSGSPSNHFDLLYRPPIHS